MMRFVIACIVEPLNLTRGVNIITSIIIAILMHELVNFAKAGLDGCNTCNYV